MEGKMLRRRAIKAVPNNVKAHLNGGGIPVDKAPITLITPYASGDAEWTCFLTYSELVTLAKELLECAELLRLADQRRVREAKAQLAKAHSEGGTPDDTVS